MLTFLNRLWRFAIFKLAKTMYGGSVFVCALEMKSTEGIFMVVLGFGFIIYISYAYYVYKCVFLYVFHIYPNTDLMCGLYRIAKRQIH